ncbi:5-carboxymethyl-2-hydroxymuconate Delta-isomerase [Psychrobacter immobilis]|uniref:5-carboxymethyl-2-hydroxymuconate Delta-isomerase n=1 Tax=Psychrobacter immobilis TaxID=498 RepID=UPI001917F84C|nr:5-carboxymethyl-2-hydroxymuconate Delta-isomerase [Psychrobacter immobilis]|tara:strand:- start:292 stop:684 length:393 start_codon:yes stop_codon:yes gene_type:complete
MPHLTYEYTDNLLEEVTEQDIQTLLKKSAQVIIDQKDMFPTGGIRVRAHRLSEYVMADASRDSDAFVHAHLKVGQGRTPEQLKKVCNELFALMETHFSDVFNKRGFALSLEYSEFANGTWKSNNLHQYYR